MSQVLYARLPDELKDATDAYASNRGATLTRAVVELLHRGLTAVAEEASIESLQTNLARTRAENEQIQAELRVAKSELQALATLAQRAGSAVGRCPNQRCREEITGYDLLGVGRCPKCEQPLTSLITPAPKSGLDQSEYMLLFGALGAVLAIAVLSSGV